MLATGVLTHTRHLVRLLLGITLVGTINVEASGDSKRL